MSTVQRLATVLEDGIRPSGADGFATRPPGRSSDAEAWDPVVELVHDLRSPLTSILVLAETLMRDVSDEVSDVHRHRLALVYGAALGLAALLTDVVDVAEGGESLLDRNPAPFVVVEVLESVARLVQPLAEAKGLTLLTLSPARDRRLGHGPALRRVLLNLVTNGLKFTDEGCVEIVATPQSGGRLTISVRDTGRGLPPSVVESLARPLGPSPTSDGHPIEPASLGLMICRRLVRSMGSELEFETWPGRGTCFHFALDLPLARVT
jgi:signal transduction histidine kinase